MKYTLTCSCGGYTANFDRKDVAEAVAEIHADLGEGHSVTCTRSAHNRPGAVPVIVFASKKKEEIMARTSHDVWIDNPIGRVAPLESQ
jgi:hypothetical protein